MFILRQLIINFGVYQILNACLNKLIRSLYCIPTVYTIQVDRLLISNVCTQIYEVVRCRCIYLTPSLLVPYFCAVFKMCDQLVPSRHNPFQSASVRSGEFGRRLDRLESHLVYGPGNKRDA